MNAKAAKATLIYDGNCPLCTAAARWIQQNAVRDDIETLPCQDEQRAARFPNVREADCMQAMQLVMPDGAVYSGDRALPHLLRRIRGWRRVAWAFSAPGVSFVAPYVYRWIAEHRYALSIFLRHKE